MSAKQKSLEERAAGITQDQSRMRGPIGQLDEEISLLLEQIRNLRSIHDATLLSILRSECSVDTDLMKLDSYVHPLLFHFRFDARDNLKNKLLDLETERRKLRLTYRKEMQSLEDRLFELLSNHALLKVS